MQAWTIDWSNELEAFVKPESGAERATFILYFGARHILEGGKAFASLRAAWPDALIVGGSTGTTISDQGIQDDGATAVAVRLDHASVRMASVETADFSSEAAGQSLARSLADNDLAAVLVLSDGLNVNGSALVKGLQSVCGPHVAIGGGLAGDGAAFAKTLVSANAPPSEGVIAAVGFYGRQLEVRMGVAHGWELFGPPRTISKAEGAVLYEMDGKPALDLYERYLGEEADQLPASALLYPLLITNPADPRDQVVRTILAVDRDARTMTFAGDVPVGWSAKLMRAASESLTNGAARAAQIATDATRAGDGGLALLVSCVGRRLAMGQRTGDEVEAVEAVLPPGFTRTGFYSYGEIATQGVAGHCGLHNQTMTVMTLCEPIEAVSNAEA